VVNEKQTVEVSLLKQKAVKLLARREHSYLELVQKLKTLTTNDNIIYIALDELVRKQYQSDKRYIEVYLANKIHKYGLFKLEADLITKTGNRKLVKEIIKSLDHDEYNTAYQLLVKKFKNNLHTDKQSKLKYSRYLHNRGFNLITIGLILTNLSTNLQ
jgi:regulatory protein